MKKIRNIEEEHYYNKYMEMSKEDLADKLNVYWNDYTKERRRTKVLLLALLFSLLLLCIICLIIKELIFTLYPI